MRKKIQKSISATLLSAALFIQNAFPAYAFKIGPNVTAADFDNYTLNGVQGIILGTVFWLLRLFGVVTLIWGITQVICAKRQGGDVRQYNGGIVKMTLAFFFLTMPAILKAANIIN